MEIIRNAIDYFMAKISLKWIEDCVFTAVANANKTIFKITDAKPYVPVVTL